MLNTREGLSDQGDFEEPFRDKLADLEGIPPQDSWDAIQTALDHDRGIDRRWYLLLLLLLVGSGGFIGGYLVSNARINNGVVQSGEVRQQPQLAMSDSGDQGVRMTNEGGHGGSESNSSGCQEMIQDSVCDGADGFAASGRVSTDLQELNAVRQQAQFMKMDSMGQSALVMKRSVRGGSENNREGRRQRAQAFGDGVKGSATSGVEVIDADGTLVRNEGGGDVGRNGRQTARNTTGDVGDSAASTGALVDTNGHRLAGEEINGVKLNAELSLDDRPLEAVDVLGSGADGHREASEKGVAKKDGLIYEGTAGVVVANEAQSSDAIAKQSYRQAPGVVDASPSQVELSHNDDVHHLDSASVESASGLVREVIPVSTVVAARAESDRRDKRDNENAGVENNGAANFLEEGVERDSTHKERAYVQRTVGVQEVLPGAPSQRNGNETGKDTTALQVSNRPEQKAILGTGQSSVGAPGVRGEDQDSSLMSVNGPPRFVRSRPAAGRAVDGVGADSVKEEQALADVPLAGESDSVMTQKKMFKPSKWMLQASIGGSYVFKQLDPAEDRFYITDLTNKNQFSIHNTGFNLAVRLRREVGAATSLTAGLSWSRWQADIGYNYYDVVADSVAVQQITNNSIEVSTYFTKRSNEIRSTVQQVGLSVGVLQKVKVLQRQHTILLEANLYQRIFDKVSSDKAAHRVSTRPVHFALKAGVEKTMDIGAWRFTITPYVQRYFGSLYTPDSIFQFTPLQLGLDLGLLLPLQRK